MLIETEVGPMKATTQMYFNTHHLRYILIFWQRNPLPMSTSRRHNLRRNLRRSRMIRISSRKEERYLIVSFSQSSNLRPIEHPPLTHRDLDLWFQWYPQKTNTATGNMETPRIPHPLSKQEVELRTITIQRRQLCSQTTKKHSLLSLRRLL